MDGSLDQVLDTLGREMGSDVRFTDSAVATGTMLSVKDVPMWQLLDALARLGPMTVGGEPYMPRKKEAKTFLDERVSMQLEDADGKAVAKALGYVLHGPVEFTPQDPEMVLSLELKDVPLREVLKKLSRFGTISIEGKPYIPE